MPSPWMIARSIPSRSILMRFAWIPGSPPAVDGADGPGEADWGAAPDAVPDGTGDPVPGARLTGRLGPAVGGAVVPPGPLGPPPSTKATPAATRMMAKVLARRMSGRARSDLHPGPSEEWRRRRRWSGSVTAGPWWTKCWGMKTRPVGGASSG